jgi:hypothetical protein
MESRWSRAISGSTRHGQMRGTLTRSLLPVPGWDLIVVGDGRFAIVPDSGITVEQIWNVLEGLSSLFTGRFTEETVAFVISVGWNRRHAAQTASRGRWCAFRRRVPWVQDEGRGTLQQARWRAGDLQKQRPHDHACVIVRHRCDKPPGAFSQPLVSAPAMDDFRSWALLAVAIVAGACVAWLIRRL